jgi:hypothetical protein
MWATCSSHLMASSDSRSSKLRLTASCWGSTAPRDRQQARELQCAQLSQCLLHHHGGFSLVVVAGTADVRMTRAYPVSWHCRAAARSLLLIRMSRTWRYEAPPQSDTSLPSSTGRPCTPTEWDHRVPDRDFPKTSTNQETAAMNLSSVMFLPQMTIATA